MPIDKVIVRGYKADGKLVMEQIRDTNDWGDEPLPLLDSPHESRVFYRVRSIDAEQYDNNGILIHKWRHYYKESGNLDYSEKWESSEQGDTWVKIDPYAYPAQNNGYGLDCVNIVCVSCVHDSSRLPALRGYCLGRAARDQP